jgi:hypothetical protein
VRTAGHGPLTYGAASDEPVKEVVQLVGLDEQLIHRHLARRRVPGDERQRPVRALGVRRVVLPPAVGEVAGVAVPGGRVHLLAERPGPPRGAAAVPALHPVLEAVVEVGGVGADEGGEVPGVGAGAVAEVEHVEHPRPTPRGVEHLLLERRVPVGEDAVHDDQRLERDRPASGPAEAARQRGDAVADVHAGEAGEREDLPDVALVGRERLAVAGGPDDGHVQVRLHGAAATDLGEADARLVLHRAQRLAQLARRHGFASVDRSPRILARLVGSSYGPMEGRGRAVLAFEAERAAGGGRLAVRARGKRTMATEDARGRRSRRDKRGVDLLARHSGAAGRDERLTFF